MSIKVIVCVKQVIDPDAPVGSLNISEDNTVSSKEDQFVLNGYDENAIEAALKIKDVRGSGGKVIKGITEETGARIDIEDDGTIKISCSDPEGGKLALEKIEDITVEPEIGEIYTGRVVKTMDFGAFVNFKGTQDGLVHISELTNRRVNRTTDIVKVGDKVKVKVVGFDNRGKIKLSMKEVKQTSERDFNRA